MDFKHRDKGHNVLDPELIAKVWGPPSKEKYTSPVMGFFPTLSWFTHFLFSFGLCYRGLLLSTLDTMAHNDSFFYALHSKF